MKKLKHIVILFFITIILITGCTKKTTQPKYTEIEFWTLQLSGFSDYINSVISNYEKANPEIKIKWVDVPFSEGEKRLLAATMSRKTPDVVNMNPDFSIALAQKNALLNIKPLLTDSEYNSYIQAAWDRVSFEETAFGVPWYITSAITIYNKQIFEKSGVEVSPESLTYEDLLPKAKKVKNAANKFIMMPSLTENGKMLKIFNAYSIPIINKEFNQATFNTTEAEAVLNLWKILYKSEYIPPESITETHRSSLEKFLSGETALLIAGANFINIIKENAPDLYPNIAVTKQITGTSNKYDFSLMNLVIPKKAKHPKEALQFALFLTNSKNQLAFSKIAPVLPSNKDALKSDFFNTYQINDIVSKGRVISAEQLKNPVNPIPELKNKKDLFEIIDYMTQEVLLEEKTPKQALEDAEKAWNKVLKN